VGGNCRDLVCRVQTCLASSRQKTTLCEYNLTQKRQQGLHLFQQLAAGLDGDSTCLGVKLEHLVYGSDFFEAETLIVDSGVVTCTH